VDTDKQVDAEILMENILRDVREALSERGSIKGFSIDVETIEEVPEKKR
jgi:hypothetical protein